MSEDPSYKQRQANAQKKWRKEKPAHEYQKHYRQTHPQYVEANRIKQKERNKKHRRKIVKIDALNSKPLNTGYYRIRFLDPKASEKIVKIDTLLVQLQQYREIAAFPP